MASDLSVIMPKILARALINLRERCNMPRLVNGDYSADAAEKGDTIDVPIPTAIGTRDVAPAAVPPTNVDVTPTKVQVPLSNWKQNDPFCLTDKDLAQVDAGERFLPMQTIEAVRGLSNLVNADLHATYKGVDANTPGVFGFVGTAGTTPFASGVTDATNTRKTLNQQLAPKGDRRMVLNHDAEANALALPQFSDAEKIGSNDVKIEGEIGRKFGMDWYADDNVTTHTAGTGAGYLVNNVATLLVGAKTAAIDTGTGTFVVGDIVTFAGHTQTYVITSFTASTAITFYPGLKAVVADNAAITIKASHVVNLCFHRDAIAFATRPLINTATVYRDIGGSKMVSMQDDATGLVMRLEVKNQHKQAAWEFDILWGARLVRPELATRIAG